MQRMNKCLTSDLRLFNEVTRVSDPASSVLFAGAASLRKKEENYTAGLAGCRRKRNHVVVQLPKAILCFETGKY